MLTILFPQWVYYTLVYSIVTFNLHLKSSRTFRHGFIIFYWVNLMTGVAKSAIWQVGHGNGIWSGEPERKLNIATDKSSRAIIEVHALKPKRSASDNREILWPFNNVVPQAVNAYGNIPSAQGFAHHQLRLFFFYYYYFQRHCFLKLYIALTIVLCLLREQNLGTKLGN